MMTTQEDRRGRSLSVRKAAARAPVVVSEKAGLEVDPEVKRLAG
jgi:hypothetical protein